MPFESPNYTQTPNDFFDTIMRDLGYAETKVVLAVIRITFGFHREGCGVKCTLTEMCAMTGLSRPALLAGAEKAEEKGLIEKKFDEDGELLWSVKLLYQGGKVALPDAVKLPNRPTYPKEREKKEEITAPPPAPKVPAEVLQVYENNIGLATAVILDDLEKAVNDYTAAWVIEALKETARARVKRLSYALKILESWKRDGFKADHASPDTPAPNGKTTNPRLHPAIVALHEITGRYPRKEVQDQLIRVIGDTPNVGDLQRCFDAWTIKGWRPDNFTWVTEWYISGIPATSKNGNGANEPKSWAAARNLMARYEREDQESQARPQH